MKRFNVLIPPGVQEQIRAQVLYIAQNSIDNALAWEDRLRAAMEIIGEPVMQSTKTQAIASARPSTKGFSREHT